MFTTKTESVNASATSAQRPSATMIATSAITSGISPATTAPKTSSRMIERRRQADSELARLEVVLREVVEVVVERPLAGHGGIESGQCVRALHRRDDVVDARVGRVDELHHRCPSVRRDERGVPRVEVAPDGVDASGGAHLAGQCPNDRVEPRCAAR